MGNHDSKRPEKHLDDRAALPRSQSSRLAHHPNAHNRKVSEPKTVGRTTAKHSTQLLSPTHLDPGHVPNRKQSIRSVRSSMDASEAVNKLDHMAGPSTSGLQVTGCRRTKSVCALPKSASGNVRSPEAACSLKLASAQHYLVRKAWQQARSKGAQEPGMTIFRNLNFKSPEIRDIFADGSNERFHECLKDHAKIFTELMDQLMANLERNEILTPALLEIGRKHVNIPATGNNRTFKSSHLDQFASAMVERTLEWGEKAQRNEFSQTAWTKIVLFFVEKIKEGYLEESKRSRREKRKQSMVAPVQRPEQVFVTVTDESGGTTNQNNHKC